MIFNNHIIELIKEKSGLCFDKAKDYDVLCEQIFSSTNRSIGVNTIKRLMGYIVDDRNTNDYTLNTIAIYLGFATWNDLCGSIRIDSEWRFDDQTVYVSDTPLGRRITVNYLNREVSFVVVIFKDTKMLRVERVQNSSLKEGDILSIDHIKVGEPLIAKTVYRGEAIGNYKTNGEVKKLFVEE